MKIILVDPNLAHTFFGKNFFDPNYGAQPINNDFLIFCCKLNKDIYSNMLFFSQEEKYMSWTQPAFTCSKWAMNTIDETVEC